MRVFFRRFPVFRFLLCLIVLGMSAQAGESNLLRNGDFSRWDASGNPEDWRPGGSYDIVRLPDGGLKVGVREAASGEGQVGQGVALPPGHIVTLSGRLRSQVPGMAFLQLKLFQGGKEVKRVNVGKSDTEWKEVSKEIFVGEADRGEVLLRFYQTDRQVGQTVEFADIALVDKGEKQIVPPAIANLEVVPTFVSAGVSVAVSGDPGPDFRVRIAWRKKGGSVWHPGRDLVFVPPENVCRGSLFDLEPGTEYEVRCEAEDPAFRRDFSASALEGSFTTWSDTVPVAREISLPPGEITESLVITDQGSETGWIRYRGDAGRPTVLNIPAGSPEAVRVQGAAYVILENVIIRGGDRHGVVIEKSHDIRIRRCDIAGWGEMGTPQPGLKNGLYVDGKGKVINLHAGVQISPGTSRIVVEENFIHSPRGTANSWRNGHPNGPQGVIIHSTEGNHVVRNNDIIGNEQHWWNDAIESLFNERRNGGPYRDTDIHGNVLAFSNDDGTELDGGQINVRYFDNWIQWAFCGVSCAPNMAGPSYVFRNLFVLGDERNRANCGFKIGGARLPFQGMIFLFNNTVVSENAGLGTGMYGPGPSPFVSRNNVFASSVINLVEPFGRHYELDYDLFPEGALLGGRNTVERHAVIAEPQFVNAAAGDYRLVPGSPGTGAGVFLEGFHSGDPNVRPDVGAFPAGAGVGNFPKRAITARPAVIERAMSQGGEAPVAEVLLEFSPGAGTSWTAHPNAGWLKVSPESGGSAKEVRVKLTLDPAGLAVGRHRAAVTFRTEQGVNRTVFANLILKPAHPVTLELEAEEASFGGNYVRREDPKASGGAYVVAPYDPARVVRYSKEDKHDSVVTFSFEVPETGLYQISARLMIPGPDALSKDSCFLSIDDGEPVFWGVAQAGKPEWNWQEMPGGAGSTGMAFSLEKGRHTLRVIQREPGLQIDKIRVTNEF